MHDVAIQEVPATRMTSNRLGDAIIEMEGYPKRQATTRGAAASEAFSWLL